MSRAVWKFRADLSSGPVVMPIGAKVLYVEPITSQSSLAVTFWAEVNLSATAIEERSFAVVGTGHPVPALATYCGTTQVHELGLVFHLYEQRADF